LRRSSLVAVAVVAILVLSLAIAFNTTPRQTASSGGQSTSTAAGSNLSIINELSISVAPASFLVPVGGNANFTVSVSNPDAVLGTFPISVIAAQELTFNVDPKSVFFTTSGSQESVNLRVSSPDNLAPGSYPAVIQAETSGGAINESVSFQVIPYLLTLNPASENSTVNLTVRMGSQVTWISLFNQNSNGNDLSPIIVISGPEGTQGSASSPSLAEYSTWSYTFQMPGTYKYSDTVFGLVKGTIVVTP
jgi:hypothetical protein